MIKQSLHGCWAVIFFCIIFLSGCQSNRLDVVAEEKQWANPDQQQLVNLLRKSPSVKSFQQWTLPDYITTGNLEGMKIETRHYQIYASLQQPLVLNEMPFFLENCYLAYNRFVGSDTRQKEKFKVLVFDDRGQWEQYTQKLAGPLADTYLKITSGAYYLNGVCVVYHLNSKVNFSILAHEGWHQFSELTFKYRLPAWLDEGIATNFESYVRHQGRIDFKPSQNVSRLSSLKNALLKNKLHSLSHLISKHAGEILQHASSHGDHQAKSSEVGAYYAQLYAWIRFLREYNYGQFNDRLQSILKDAYIGQGWPMNEILEQEALQRNHNASRQWNYQVGRLLFSEYITKRPEAIESLYLAFCRKIVHTLR